MKKSITLCIVATSIVLLVSCIKKSNGTSYTSTMTSTIGGSNYTANSVGGLQGTINGVNDLTITGTNGSIMIVLNVWGYNNAPGSFPIGTSSAAGTSTASYNPGTTLSTQKSAVRGNVTITGISGGVVSGTFNFVATDSTNVSNGNFAVKLL